MNSSFAKLLDFVEDRAKEESGEGVEGHRESRFMERSKDEEPGMDESQRLRSLKRVKEESRKRKSFDGIDVSPKSGSHLHCDVELIPLSSFESPRAVQANG